MRYDAVEERWMPMEIRDIRGYFNDLKIDRCTVPEGPVYGNWKMGKVMAFSADTESRFYRFPRKISK